MGYRNKYGVKGKIGFGNSGPSLVLTPLCVMGFDSDGEMILKAIHPGHSLEEVLDNTGFDLRVPEEVLTTKPPTVKEITALRTQVDTLGVLREAF
ncbi:MAG: hypothetical protein D9V47_07055 [Clostridia bacterium]|nr:MAG: hypothetical protein D9V47_07055 [Clostridia bacterium]